MKNYIDELADDIGERCDIKNERLLRMYAMVALLKGTDATKENVHDAWAAWMLGIDPRDPEVGPFDESGVAHNRSLFDHLCAIIDSVEAKLHREARAEMDHPKPSSRSPEQARPGD